MNEKRFWLGLCLMCALVVLVPLFVTAQPISPSGVPVPTAGAATLVDCSNVASAASGALSAGRTYWVYCNDDTYIRWGTAAPTAAAGDMILPSGDWLAFRTSSTILYYAVLNVNVDGACYHLRVD